MDASEAIDRAPAVHAAEQQHAVSGGSDSSRRGSGEHLVLYDGVCGLCNRLVQFVLRHDERGRFDFASLQSATGHTALERFGRNADDLDTVYVLTRYRGGQSALHGKADVAMFVLATLGSGWRVVALLLRMLPKGVRNRGYDMVARHRYRVFGRYDTCLLPSAGTRNRFIDV